MAAPREENYSLLFRCNLYRFYGFRTDQLPIEELIRQITDLIKSGQLSFQCPNPYRVSGNYPVVGKVAEGDWLFPASADGINREIITDLSNKVTAATRHR